MIYKTSFKTDILKDSTRISLRTLHLFFVIVVNYITNNLLILLLFVPVVSYLSTAVAAVTKFAAIVKIARILKLMIISACKLLTI